jgi:hypothetical protein
VSWWRWARDTLDSLSPVHNVVNPVTGVTHHGWTPVLLTTLKSLGVTPDFLIYHRYEQGPGGESDALLLQAARTWPNDAAALREQLTDYLYRCQATNTVGTATSSPAALTVLDDQALVQLLFQNVPGRAPDPGRSGELDRVARRRKHARTGPDRLLAVTGGDQSFRADSADLLELLRVP